MRAIILRTRKQNKRFWNFTVSLKIWFVIVIVIPIIIVIRYYMLINLSYILVLSICLLSITSLLYLETWYTDLYEKASDSEDKLSAKRIIGFYWDRFILLIMYAFLFYFGFQFLRGFVHEFGHLLVIDVFHLQVVKFYIAPSLKFGYVLFSSGSATPDQLSMIIMSGSLTSVLVSLLAVYLIHRARINFELKLLVWALLLYNIYQELIYWSNGIYISGSDAYQYFSFAPLLDKVLAKAILDGLVLFFSILSILALVGMIIYKVFRFYQQNRWK